VTPSLSSRKAFLAFGDKPERVFGRSEMHIEVPIEQKQHTQAMCRKKHIESKAIKMEQEDIHSFVPSNLRETEIRFFT
jgi:hypothetical protein